VNWRYPVTQLRQLWLTMATLAIICVCPPTLSNSDGYLSDSPIDNNLNLATDPNLAIDGSVEQLDRALDKSLEEFDQSMANSGSNNLDQSANSSGYETDILSPRSNTEIQPTDPSVNLEILVGGVDIPVFGGSGEPVPPGSPTLDSADNKSPAAEGDQSTDPNSPSSSSSQQGQGFESIPLPEDIGDGQGDNIVERQIREAAINESDPVLRERLWDEYRKIKNQ